MASHYAVPVDQRWLGMDRRGIPYAAVAIGLIAILIGVVPAINSRTGWDNPTVAGDVIDLGGGITIAPPVDWQLESGTLTSAEPINAVNPDGASAVLSNGATSLQVNASTWSGTADTLLDQYNKLRDSSDATDDRLFAVTGARASVTTNSGVTGVQESYSSATGDGRAFAFVVDSDKGKPIGVVIAASASAGTLSQDAAQVDAFVSSLTATGAAS